MHLRTTLESDTVRRFQGLRLFGVLDLVGGFSFVLYLLFIYLRVFFASLSRLIDSCLSYLLY